MSIGKLTRVSVSGQQSVALGWDDGLGATVDLSRVIDARPALAPLADPQHFALVAVSDDGWSIEWPGGFDFGAPQLRRWADEQAGESMPAEAFRRWIGSYGFTLDRAAETLGLSRRAIAYYLSGEHPIPKTVMLATEGWDARHAA